MFVHTSAGVREFSADMTAGQLHDWLQAKQMPLADCKIIKGTHVATCYIYAHKSLATYISSITIMIIVHVCILHYQIWILVGLFFHLLMRIPGRALAYQRLD